MKKIKEFYDDPTKDPCATESQDVIILIAGLLGAIFLLVIYVWFGASEIIHEIPSWAEKIYPIPENIKDLTKS